MCREKQCLKSIVLNGTYAVPVRTFYAVKSRGAKELI